MQADIAIVIAAYNRADSLKRLLHSIAVADYTDYNPVPLLISIDYSGSNACAAIAESFEWEHGPKNIIYHKEKLGLKKHILSCGDFVTEYDAVIVLEDDLFVAPGFYDYAQQAFNFYKDDAEIAGIGLYSYRYNEFAHCPFEPITDGFDNYFMQIPCSWGQLWTRNQWCQFKSFLSREATTAEQNLVIPSAVLQWPVTSSWKRLFFIYIVEEKKYFVYPRIGLTTNFGDAGTHFVQPEFVWQIPLLLGKKSFRFSSVLHSLSVYDSFFELESSVYNKITGNRVSVSFDLNGTKPLHLIRTEYLISSKGCSQPKQQFQPELYPYEWNILTGIEVKAPDSLVFTLGKTTHFYSIVPVNRLSRDVKRILPHLDYMLHISKKEVQSTKMFRLRNRFIRILHFPVRVVNKIKSLI